MSTTGAGDGATLDERAAALRADGVPYVHARVVLAERPTSAHPGDQALVFADGSIEGFVGGECAEATVRAQGLARLEVGEPLLLRISPTPEEPQSGKLTVHNPCLSGGSLEIFLRPVVPAPLVLVHGSTPIAVALAALGAAMGYRVQMLESAAAAMADGAAAVVVASHGRDEEAVLTAALAARAHYVGLVASPKRGQSVLASLGVDEAARAHVRTPAGLDIGAHTPEEIALSILAEIVADRRHHSGPPVVRHETPSSATALDPVCGMTVTANDASLHLDHEGVRYWFCGTGCVRAFAADPAAYL